MSTANYRELWSTNHQRKGGIVTIPANVERRDHHEPCSWCGVRPDVPCKHKGQAA